MNASENKPSAAEATSTEASATPQSPVSYITLFATFFKAGCLGFGGFMSLISVVQNILVEKKKLLRREDMLDAITLASILPGPQAVNVVALSGSKLRGTVGAIVAAVAVILPSFVLMLVLSYLYQHYGKNPVVMSFFKGFLPAVTAVITSVAWKMARKQVQNSIDLAIMLVALAALVLIPKDFRLYATFLLVICFGLAGYFLFYQRNTAVTSVAAAANPHRFPWLKVGAVLVMVALLIALLYVRVAPHQFDSLFNLTKTFGGLSVMLFGGGYVIIPMIRHHVVDVFGWLSNTSFTDAIAFSQVMPGPILIAATFIGYQVQGLAGALFSTVAIFAPPAIVMVVASQAADYLKRSAIAASILRGIRSGVIGMIFFAALELALTAETDSLGQIIPFVVIFAASLYALMKHNVDVAYLTPLAGVVGYFLYR
ncbi:MAG: chromate efflux transporter [Chitinophagales bacterium]|nr:chromate efflux transporter [Chitinophagales bacterium]MDW8427814.1 chromate efflux transporter [Chitinophagales bacterium]